MYLIVDANVILGAVLGRSLALIAAVDASGTTLVIPRPMMREAERIVGDPRRVTVAGAALQLQALKLLVRIIEPVHYGEREARARERLSRAGQPDWPLVAASLALDAPVWSNDKHLWGSGIAVWRTRTMQFWSLPHA